MGYQVVDVVPDSPEWEAERLKSLGASEVPAVLGLSPYQTPLSVYQSKMGIPNDFDPERAYVGHAAEVLIEGWIRKFHPELGEVLPAVMVRSVESPWLHASLDRVIEKDGVRVPVQMKSAHYFGVKDWQEGTPLLVQAQIQPEIFCFDAPYGYSAVFGGDMKCRLYRVERDDSFIEDHLIIKTREFWEGHVLAKLPPEPVTSAEAVELWPGDPELSVEGGEPLYELWSAYGLKQAEAVEISQELDSIKLELQKAMADATELTYQGQTLFTWKPRKGSARLDGAALKKELPDVAAQYTKQGAPTRTFIRKTVKEVTHE